VGSGWALYNDIGGEVFEELHEAAANLMLAVVAVHILGVALASRLHHENLVGAMFSGRKPAAPADGIHGAWRSVGVLVLVAVLGFWAWEWQDAPATNTTASASATTDSQAGHRPHARHHDDD